MGSKADVRSVAKAVLVWIFALAPTAWLLAREPAPDLIFGVYGHLRFLALLVAGYALAWGLYFWVGSAPLREKLLRSALTTGSLLFSLGLIESTSALGLVDYGRILPGGAQIPVGYASLNPKWWRLDPELIHMRHPHQRIQGEISGDIRALPESEKRVYAIDLEYDANGFRRGSDRARAAVVLIGDSFVEAGLVPDPATTASLLQQELGRNVANLGITMYGPQQELAVLRRYGLPLDPDVVLWFFFEGNDLRDHLSYEGHRQEVERLFSGYDRYSRRSFLMNLGYLLASWTGPRPQADHRFARSCVVGVGERTQRIYFRYGGTALDPETAEGLDGARRAIESAHVLAGGVGAEFGLLYVPTKFRVYRDHCLDAEGGRSPPSWRVDDLPQQMQAWSAERGIPFLNLTPALQARAGTEPLLYFPDDSHWTPLGNERVAAAVLDFLGENGWLERE